MTMSNVGVLEPALFVVRRNGMRSSSLQFLPWLPVPYSLLAQTKSPVAFGRVPVGLMSHPWSVL